MTLRRRSLRLFATLSGLLAITCCAAAHPGTEVAIIDLTALISAAPGSAELHLRRAACFVEHQRWREAAADLDRAASLEPSHAGLALAGAEFFSPAGILPQPSDPSIHCSRKTRMIPRRAFSAPVPGCSPATQPAPARTSTTPSPTSPSPGPNSG